MSIRKVLRALARRWPRFAEATLERLVTHSPRVGPLHVMTYRGFGDERRAWLRGRVVEGRALPRPLEEGASSFAIFRAMAGRFRARGAAGVRVRVRYGAGVRVAETDDRGSFEVDVDSESPAPTAGPGWRSARLEVLHPRAAEPSARGEVLAPAPGARFGVISDIDDTVVVTQATDRLRMLRVVLFEGPHGRLPFAGVAAFYRALAEVDGRPQNPFFYVSSSAWDIYDVLTEFMALHELPAGPLLLRELLLSRRSLLGRGRHDHKVARIRAILAAYPRLPFILSGDSGQRDPELYLRVVREQPERVLAIYIREVHRASRRREEVEAIAREVRRLGSELVLVPDTYAAARHAAARGWIDPRALGGIDAERAEDAAPVVTSH